VSDSFDPWSNIDGGSKYLRYLLNQFNGNLSLALAAYNAGEGAVAKYRNTIPPYPETQTYVRRVLSFFQKYSGEN
jgi:soluble lytic murein transglycosylase-like protein